MFINVNCTMFRNLFGSHDFDKYRASAKSIGVFSNDYDQVYLGASENALISSREKLSLI